jgi:hypothetical protein
MLGSRFLSSTALPRSFPSMPRWIISSTGERSRVVAALRGGLGGAELDQAGSIGIGLVRLVVPDPPLVRRSLRVTLGRVLPLLRRHDSRTIGFIRF